MGGGRVPERERPDRVPPQGSGPGPAAVEAPGRKHIYHLYVVRTQNREGLRQHLEGRGVAVGIHYPVPVHLQAAYKDLGYAEGAFPITEQHAAHVLSLPMFPELTEEQIGYTVTAVREAAAR